MTYLGQLYCNLFDCINVYIIYISFGRETVLQRENMERDDFLKSSVDGDGFLPILPLCSIPILSEVDHDIESVKEVGHRYI